MRVSRLPVALALLFVAAPPVHAQGGIIERLLGRMSNVNAFLLRGGLAPDGQDVGGDRAFGLRGFGIEFAIGVGTVERGEPKRVTRLEPREVHVTGSGESQDTTTIYDWVDARDDSDVETIALFDIGVGYSQQWGFTSLRDDFAFTGSLRELPSLTFYVTMWPEREGVSPYLGLRSGLVQLHEAHFQTPSPTTAGVTDDYPLAAQAFQMGVVAGGVWDIQGVNIFSEISYNHRYFAGINMAGKRETYPATLPRTLNLSGYQVSLGFQYGLPSSR
jgi:hypothetical protein